MKRLFKVASSVIICIHTCNINVIDFIHCQKFTSYTIDHIIDIHIRYLSFQEIERSGLKGPIFDGYVMRSAEQNFSVIIATEITKVCFNELIQNLLTFYYTCSIWHFIPRDKCQISDLNHLLLHWLQKITKKSHKKWEKIPPKNFKKQKNQKISQTNQMIFLSRTLFRSDLPLSPYSL
jgi:hypothetical protein